MFNFTREVVLGWSISIGLAVIVGLLAWRLVDFVKSKNRNIIYRRQLEELIEGEIFEDEFLDPDNPKNIVEKWNLYWSKLGRLTKYPRYNKLRSPAGRDVILLFIGTFAVISVLTQNLLLGLIFSVIAVFAISQFSNFYKNKRERNIRAQLPGFLFALRANIQANLTPMQALIKIVDNMPNPLKEDLLIAKRKLLSNIPLQDALKTMAEQTISNELKFLAACIIQAATNGANIEVQLDTIQNVLEQRREAEDALARAVHSVTPTIVAATAVIPVAFIGTYLISAESRKYWFNTLSSWLAFVMIIFLYGVGVAISRKLINNIKNL